MKSILHDEITRVDNRLVDQFRKKSDISGSTAVIAIRLIHSNTLLVANVGDSRAILCDWKGATIPLSFDHKPYQVLSCICPNIYSILIDSSITSSRNIDELWKLVATSC